MIFENGVAPFALRYHKKQISKIKKNKFAYNMYTYYICTDNYIRQKI